MTSDYDATPDFSYDQRSDVVRDLYRSFLEREPDAHELAEQVGQMEACSPYAAVMAIIYSEEAKAIRERRAAPDPGAVPDGYLLVRRDDVMRLLGHTANDTAAVPVSAGVAPPSPPGIDDQDIARVISAVYRMALRRQARAVDIDVWSRAFRANGMAHIVAGIGESEEAKLLSFPGGADTPPGVLVQMAFEIILDRGAAAHEVDAFRKLIESDDFDAVKMVIGFFNDRVAALLSVDPPVNDPSRAFLFGSHGVIDSSDLPSPESEPDDKSASPHGPGVLGDGSVLAFNRAPGVAVSIITSLYRGGRFIRSFLDNITSQTIFRDHCELIIVDAASPEGEGAVIEEYRERYPNIVYKRMDSRIGIYDAWNVGVAMARGRYLTNANLDDCRREDSLEIQAAVLDTLDFADVTYQDVCYTFEAPLPFDRIAAFGLCTDLPIVTRYNIMQFNSPHNAPMWRRTLHDEIGLFDPMVRSAGDFDFWLRCLAANKVFYKVNAAHVAYYVNPRGISTRPDTRGISEANAISRRYYRGLVSPLLTDTPATFLRQVDALIEAPVRAGSRYDIVQAALCRLGADSRGSAAEISSGGHHA